MNIAAGKVWVEYWVEDTMIDVRVTSPYNAETVREMLERQFGATVTVRHITVR